MLPKYILTKRASALGQTFGRATGTALGYLIPYVGNKYLVDATRSLASSLKRSKDFPSIIQRVKRTAGMEDIPHKIIDGIENAAFVPPNILSGDEERALVEKARRKKSLGYEAESNVLKSIVDSSNSQNGGLIIGKNMSNPYTVAHELGHAILENEGSVSGFLQRHAEKANIAGNIMTGLGLLPGAYSLYGMVTGEDTPVANKLARSLIYGGMSANILGDIGRLVYENRANEIGRKLIEQLEINLSDKDKETGEEMFSSALGTYAVSPLKHLLPVVGYEVGKSLF